MKKKEGWRFGKLLILAMTIALVASVAITAYTTDEQKPVPGTALQGVKNATPDGPTILPDASMVVERTPVETEPIHNPAGSQMLVAQLTIPVTCDGSIDATEWSDAYSYDVSDLTGQSDGIPDPAGTVILWLKQDENGVYFAIRNNADQVLDEYDQCGLYFDDNHDGCFPPTGGTTDEGNNWFVWTAAGLFAQWRWWQDNETCNAPAYVCYGDVTGGNYTWAPPCFGIGIGPTGVVDYEVMMPYGVVDEYIDLTMPPDSLGFYMYCLDNGQYVFNGEWPSQSRADTYREPCYYGHLICEGGEEWPNHKMHFPQLPDLIGWDVNATFPKTLADDWQCSRTGPVEDIHFWGSWKNLDGDPTTDDYYTPMPFFQLSIHRNVPASADTPWSRPGELLWFWEGEIGGVPSEPPTLEAWLDPNTGEVVPNDHVPYWQYDFFFNQAQPPPAPFYQYQDSIYWLNVSAMNIPPPYQWGWKNSRDHFEDDATYTDNPPVGPWFPIIEPPRQNWFDAFFITNTVTDYGSTNYYGDGWYYYPQYNWMNMWFYNNPFTLDRQKHIWMDFYLDDLTYDAQFALNWSTPAWDEMGMGRPPLPEDGNEDVYIGRQQFPIYQGPNTIDFWLPYNPEWVSIDFRGTIFFVNGWIWHECVQTSLDLAFVITGPECTPSIDVEKKVWDEANQDWVDFVDLNVGDTAQFQIAIHNDGTCCDLTNIDVYDLMDASLEFLYAEPPPDAVQTVPEGTELSWLFPGPLAPCEWIYIRLFAEVLGPDCHTDSNYVFVEAYCETGDLYVSDQDAAHVHAIGPPWPDHKMHFPQLPDPQGWDVVATQGYDWPPGIVVADDFMCMKTGPITDVHLWGSWLWDVEVPIQGFWLSIHDNIPGPPYSMPGPELWSAYVTDFEVTPEGQDWQGWWDPFIFFMDPQNHMMYYRYDIDSLPDPFYQDSGTIYWLNVMADIGPPGYMAYPEPPLWGWKTSLDHFEDTGVWGIPGEGFWEPLFDPMTGGPLDLAFVITGGVICGDANGSGDVEAGDIVYLISYLFRNGPAPVPLCIGDANCSGDVEAGDVVYLISYLFRNGPAPCPYCCL